ncbi:MAG: hypothetical protein CMJ33_00585 [Phycisphaerae bacterium]|nr:hypothetical protein [Phycisphaerae bacterium]
MIGSPATSLIHETSRSCRISGCMLLLAVACGFGCSVAQNDSRSTRDQVGPTVPMESEPVAVDSRSSIRPSQSGSVGEVPRLAPIQRPSASDTPASEQGRRLATPAPDRVLTPAPSSRVESFEAEVVEADALKLGPREQAISILLAAGRSEWPQFRANALEALTSDVQLLRGEIVTGLLDENRGVRFVALMALYTAALWELAPLVEPMLEDPSDSVRAAALLVLQSSGRTIDPTPLAAMATSGDPEIRANAYVVLGLMGNKSAAGLIRDSLTDSLGLIAQDRIRIVDLQAAAALVRLGDAQEIEPLRAALFAPVEQSELTALAIQALVELEDKGSTGMLVRLVEASGDQQRPPEIRLFAASALARLGMQEPAPLLRLASEYLAFDDPLVRAQVALLLGDVSDPTALRELTVMMRDSSPIVQLAAAGGVLKLLPPSREALDAPSVPSP